jgi:ATPase subunit of ABC transporter with duplicated ATPase domains
MIHKPIQLNNITLSFSHKTCFEDFSASISYGSRIAIIGRNGSGKSSLLNMLQRNNNDIKMSEDVVVGYVPQLIEEFDSLSGGQRLNEALTQALNNDPNLLLLDEPTNHLDRRNKKSLMRMLMSYSGTLIIVSHDLELLRQCVDTIWHIENGKIHIFSGNYDDYKREVQIKRNSIEETLTRVTRQKKELHQNLMKEQERAKKSDERGVNSIRNHKWPTITSAEKARRAIVTSGKKKKNIKDQRDDLIDKLSSLQLPEIIMPKFSLVAKDNDGRNIISINEGAIGYKGCSRLLADITLSLAANDRVAILGDNGSGKSTLVKAILNDFNVLKSGDWYLPKIEDIGYLDQHYNTLLPEKSVLDHIQDLRPNWTHAEIRKHLNEFLFRKNEEVQALIYTLSGGEKARLTLAQIAAKTPKLLILDEMTNNLDIETRNHVIQVLRDYPGALIVISHDEDFLNAINVDKFYKT